MDCVEQNSYPSQSWRRNKDCLIVLADGYASSIDPCVLILLSLLERYDCIVYRTRQRNTKKARIHSRAVFRLQLDSIFNGIGPLEGHTLNIALVGSYDISGGGVDTTNRSKLPVMSERFGRRS